MSTSMAASRARRRLAIAWVAVVAVAVSVGLAISWLAGLAVFLIGDALVLLRLFTGGALGVRSEELAGPPAAPYEPPPPRAVWKFTSWRGRATAEPTHRPLRATYPKKGATTYSPYEPATGADGDADSAPGE
ncbi:hypothetical protein DJ010_10090 [Nocardioides silvaticus]|uniref:Uncharacterized protein n=1 Tax=Nocardioides silvaticus TaxID=2201891 RepID=A0A316TE76_9ACTN|nr:hypothetical protein [Nocardioides silvaticus]PWN02763.1 hypothetical protein DJ010_10090 [Nocardioides silvaticus]